MVTTLVQSDPMAKDKTTRVQMDLSVSSMQRLRSLKDETEATSYAEVTKEAYRLLDRLLEFRKQGYKILLEDKQGKQKEIVFLGP